MTMKFACQKCDKEMSVVEDAHLCECGHSLSIDEAQSAFEDGSIVGIIDESETSNHEDVVVADLSEDVQALVEGLELSEESAEKAKVILEAAVASRVKQQVEVLEAKASAYAEYVKETIEEELVEKVDGYLDLVVSEWVSENELSIESGIKSQMDETLVEGLASLLKEHYVQAPEERWDIVEGLAEKVEDLEAKLDESMDATIEAKKDIQEAKKAIVFSRLAEGLAETQKEKFLELAEEAHCDSTEEFTDKLVTLKESYFGSKSETKETFVVEDSSASKTIDDSMAQAVRLLSRK